TNLGLTDRVMFLGKQDSVAELLACADLFLLPSASESFGLSALEAMASGAPVVATRVGGIPEVVRDGVGGYLADVGDVETMSAASLDILSDDAEWKRMSRSAREAALEFRVDRIVPLYERFYQEVLETAAADDAGRGAAAPRS